MKKTKKAFEKFKAKMKRRRWAEINFGPMTPAKKQKLMERNAEKLRTNMTGPEKVMVDILNEMGIEHESQYVLGRFIYDFYVPECNLFIEVDGDYYHGHPDKYAPKDLNAMQRKIKRNDIMKNKTAMIKKFGLLRFWECDINNNMSMVKDELKKYLNEHKS